MRDTNRMKGIQIYTVGSESLPVSAQDLLDIGLWTTVVHGHQAPSNHEWDNTNSMLLALTELR
jgi:hypothetical protein